MNLTLRNVEERLQNIGKARIKHHGRCKYDSLFLHRSLFITQWKCNAVEEEGTCEGKPGENEIDLKEKDSCNAERKAGHFDIEIRPAEATLFAPVTSESEDVSVVPVVHMGIQCDGCNVRHFPHQLPALSPTTIWTVQKEPITGTRWKCVICADYDLCSKCYKKVSHDPRMLAIEHPDLRYLYEKVCLCFS